MPNHSTSRTQSLRILLEGLTSVVAPDVQVADVTLDSREVQPGSLFFALSGRRTHGLAFASEVIAKKAAVILYEPAPNIEAPVATRNTTVVAIPGLSTLVGSIADRFFDSPSAAMRVVGVTGTNGKTTSAYLIPSALAMLNRSAGYAGTLGFGHVGALQTSAHTTADCVTVHRQLAAMRDAGDGEVGMEVSSHALDQGRIDGVRVYGALFTNLTRDHLDYHGTFEAYGAAKEKLFHRPGLRFSAINVDDAFGRELIARARSAAVIAYATTPMSRALGDQQLFATKIATGSKGLRIAFDGSWGAGELDSHLIGTFNAENLLGVLAVLLQLDVPLADATRALAACHAPPGRMETVSAPMQPLVVIDYAHTPDALSKALQTARAHTKARLVCVFGCGGDRDAGKRPLMGEIAEQLADVVVLTDDNPRMEDGGAIVADILQGIARPSAVIVERDRAKAIAKAVALATPNDLVLIAGKGHENYQIVGRNVKNFSDRDVARKCLGVTS